MKKILQFILPFELSHKFSDESTYHMYKKWEKPARQAQICSISFLTAVLYITFSFLDKSWASEETQAMMLKVHLIIIAPLLLSISFLAYKKLFYNILMPALALTHIFAIASHIYITNQLNDYTLLLSEGYLGIVWVFMISGLSFRFAVSTASVTSTMLVVSGYYIMSNSDIYTMHIFWVFCSFSFGFLGAYIFNSSRKTIFMNQQELHQLAIIDELSGTHNRNHLNTVLTTKMLRDLQNDKTFGILIIDIDNFKNINDNYGHTTGDKVIQKIALVLSRNIRSDDTLVRWGGDEFVIISNDGNNEKPLMYLCEKLRKKIEDGNYDPVAKVTVSIGATIFKTNDSQDILLSRADKALYDAKAKGRNISVTVQ